MQIVYKYAYVYNKRYHSYFAIRKANGEVGMTDADCIYICVYVYIYIYIYRYRYAYIYINTHIYREE